MAGTENPRFLRYHRMVSAPELWNPKALEIARQHESAEIDRRCSSS